MLAIVELIGIMRYSFILITILFAACHSGREANTYFYQGRVVVDSADQGNDFLPFDEDDNGAYYPVYYIGKQTDTLFLAHRPISMFTNEELENQYDFARNWNSTADMKIGIHVDTTINVGHDIVYFQEKETKVVDSTKSIKAFIVFITNLSDSLVMMGSHNFVGYLTREVQDKDGNWIEIERPLTDLCGTAKRSLILQPSDIMVAKLLRYEGDTKALCRLKASIKFGNAEAYRTYSNEYMDYFNIALTTSR
jgi:hypothetical protein